MTLKQRATEKYLRILIHEVKYTPIMNNPPMFSTDPSNLFCPNVSTIKGWM